MTDYARAEGVKCPGCRGPLRVREVVKLMAPALTHREFSCLSCSDAPIAEYEFHEEKLVGPITNELSQAAIDISWRARQPREKTEGFYKTFVGMLASMDADEGNRCPYIGPPEDD